MPGVVAPVAPAAVEKIKLLRLSHVRYGHADMEKHIQFMDDFGLDLVHQSEDGKVLYFGGTGIDPYSYVAYKTDVPEYYGGAYAVETREDLERALVQIPGAKGPFKLDAPGGGEIVTCADPDGIQFHLTFGVQTKEPVEPGEKKVHNFPVTKPRVGKFIRLTKAPAKVHKVGHYGNLVSNYARTYEFFTTNFNLVASDILFVPGEKEGEKISVAAFLHIDRGADYVDHHTFFFSENSKRTGPHHCSFEVQDIDTQFLGHAWLEERGYKPEWGVGRHILGSQIFDYWWMPESLPGAEQPLMIEHYADGDLLNNEYKTGFLPAADEGLAVWGPAVPDGFLD